MKKYNIILSLLMFCMLSCSDRYDDSESFIGDSDKEVMFAIDLQAEPLSIMTRGFFDDTAETKPWEMELNTLFLSIHVENEKHNVLKRYTFTKEEIASGKILVSVPETYINKDVRFLAYANYVNVPAFDVPYTIFSKRSGSYTTYKGTYNEVVTGVVPKSGFEMTGSIVFVCPTADQIVPLTIHLERLVNKVAIKTLVGDDFRERYNGGDLKINKVTVNNISETSYLLRSDEYYGSGARSTDQVPVYENGYYNNLFYLFETNNQIEIVIDGVFDPSGKFSSSVYQQNVKYRFYTSIGSVNTNRRNDYYRLSINIKTLPDNISPSFVLDEDWSNIVDIDLGYDDFIEFIENKL